jgi:YVTN family beta-propeller protein
MRLLLLMCSVSGLFLANNSHADFGDIVAQYKFPASSLVMSPTESLIYATIPSQNSLAIINSNTLVVEVTVFVGSSPTNLAFSPDGLKAYIANSTSNFVAVFDTQSRTVVDSFLLPEQPQDVVFGNMNRLWVLGQTQIYQIDATTGASTGPNVSGVFVYSGSLEISPDRNTLYYGDYGLSPSTMYKIDVSGSIPVLLLQTPFGTAGSNGEDLTLSHDGNYICYTTGAGQNNYDIAKYRTSDFASLGDFVCGPYPQAFAFSPDDLIAYASVNTAMGIKAFDANTFLLLGTMMGPDVATKLTVDLTGRYLFAAYPGFFGFTGTNVFDTGRSVPTPTPTPTPTASPTPTSTQTPTCTPAIITLKGSITDNDPTKDSVIGTVSSCAVSPVCPGALPGPYHYDAYQLTNPSGNSTCITLTLSDPTCIYSEVYLGSFDPNDACTNYLADNDQNGSYSITVPGSATIWVLVEEFATGGCANYTVTVSGLGVCASPTPTASPPPTASPSPTATATATATPTPTATATPRPTPTPRPAPTPRPRP